jgi:hypothetical protein
MSAVPPELLRKTAKSLYTGMLLELLFVNGLFPLVFQPGDKAL